MSTGAPRAPLDVERIVTAAIDLADEHGLDGASMRGVAERLGVTPMALYKHVTDRSHLVDEMLDHVLADVVPTSASGSYPDDVTDWRAAVRARVLACRAVLVVHPWARDAIETRPLATPRVLDHMDALMAAMFRGGLSADLVHHAMHALSTRMWGFTRDVLPTPRLPDDPDERARAVAGYAVRYPAIIRMASSSHAGAGCDDDAELRFALDLVLDGIQSLHDRGWTPSD